MLILRRAQLEQEVNQHMNQLLGVEARLRYIAREGAMPADDIVAKTIPEMGVVVLTGKAPAFHDLVRWIDEHGYGVVPVPGHEVWLNEVDDVADVAQQVFEIQLPFTRMAGPPGSLGGSRRLRGQPPRTSHEQRGDT